MWQADGAVRGVACRQGASTRQAPTERPKRLFVPKNRAAGMEPSLPPPWLPPLPPMEPSPPFAPSPPDAPVISPSPSPPPPFIDECDPSVELPTEADFRLMDDSVKTMQSGVSQRERLCPRMWRWFKMPTTGTRTRRYSEQQVGADGVTRPVELSEEITERMSIVIDLSTEWYQKANRYESVDIVYAAGDLNLPLNWRNPDIFDPTITVNGRANEVAYYGSRDAWTFTLGYESDHDVVASRAALPEFGCARAAEECRRVCTNMTDPLYPTGCGMECTMKDLMAETVWVGVRCSWDLPRLPCYFDLEYTLLPRHMSDGDVVRASIAAGEHHYFTVALGPFDVLVFELTRRGMLEDNFDLTQTFIEEDEETGEPLQVRRRICSRQGNGEGRRVST